MTDAQLKGQGAGGGTLAGVSRGRPRLDRARLSLSLARALETEAAYGHGFLWLAFVMVLGAGAWRMLPTDPEPLAILAIVVAFSLLAWRASGPTRAAFALVAAFCAGMASAGFEAARIDLVVMDGPVVTNIVGVVEARELDDRDHWRYTIRITGTSDPEISRPPTRMRLLARSDHDAIGIGGTIKGLARIAPPSGPAMPGTFDFAHFAYYQKLGAYGFFYGAPAAGPPVGENAGWRAAVARQTLELREAIAMRIRSVIGGDAGAVAAAMTVSDRRAISEETDEVFRVTGLSHILSISGLHMSLAAAIMFTGLRLGLSLFPVLVERYPVKKLAALGALVSSTFYLVISGAVIPAQRAWIMVAIMLVAVLLDRAALTLRNVAIAAIVVVILSPSAVSGPGFQMSFAATAALVSGYAGWLRYRGENMQEGPVLPRGLLTRWSAVLAGMVATTVLAGLATGIFSAYHFHRMTGYGMVANIAAMPIISAIVMPSGTFALLAMPFGLDQPFLLAMGWGLEAIIAIANWIAAQGGDFATGQLSFTVAGLLTLALIIAVLCRTRLAWLAVVPATLAALILVALPPDRPDVIINEEGDLVALVTSEGLASNRERPSDFIFSQWLSATRRELHLPPEILPQPAGETDQAAMDEEEPPIAPAQATADLRGLAADLPFGSRKFRCLEDSFCLARLAPGSLITIVENGAYLGPACDISTIVVTPRRVEMNRCRSGALLLTAPLLRQSGSVAIYLDELSGKATARGGGASDGEGAPGDEPNASVRAVAAPISPERSASPEDRAGLDRLATTTRPSIRVESAIGGIIRPWTRHRFYDWRSRRFAEPSSIVKEW